MGSMVQFSHTCIFYLILCGVPSQTNTTQMTTYLYVIHCLDDQSCGMTQGAFGDTRFGGSIKRIGAYAEHKAWQGETSNPESPNFIKKICAGPMESEDGKYMIGSCFIVEATRVQAEAFIANDPFKAAGVWEQVSIIDM